MTNKSKKSYRQTLLRRTPYQRAHLAHPTNISKEMVMELIESNERVNFGPYGHGCSPVAITKAENRLGLVFPPSYVWWLKTYGGGEVGGREIYSVYENYHDQDVVNDTSYPGDIVYVAQRARKREILPSDKLEIMSVDGDEVFYFDTRQKSAEGEWAVSLLEAGADEEETYARSFLEFLYKIIR